MTKQELLQLLSNRGDTLVSYCLQDFDLLVEFCGAACGVQSGHLTFADLARTLNFLTTEGLTSKELAEVLNEKDED